MTLYLRALRFSFLPLAATLAASGCFASSSGGSPDTASDSGVFTTFDSSMPDDGSSSDSTAPTDSDRADASTVDVAADGVPGDATDETTLGEAAADAPDNEGGDGGPTCGPVTSTPATDPDAGSYTSDNQATCGGFTMECSCMADSPDWCFCAGGKAAPACSAGSLSDCGYPAACTADLSSDPLNCGRCGHDCMGLTCSGGVCQPQALSFGSGGHSATDWVSDNTYIYASQCVGQAVFRLPVGGLPNTTAPTLYASGQSCPLGIAIDSSNVYWLVNGDASVWSAPISGTGTAVQIGTYGQQWFTPSPDPWHALASDASSLYFAVSPSNGSGGYTFGYVFSIPKTGGVARVLVNDSFVIGGTVAVDVNDVYFASQDGSNDGQLRSVPKAGVGDGGASTLLATFTGEPLLDVIVLSDGIYVAGVFQHIWRVPFGGGTPAVVYDGGAFAAPRMLGSDGTTMFWTDFYNGQVGSVALAGGYAQRVSLQPTEADRILVDANSVYFTSSNMSGFWRVPRGYRP
jgi:hypothetical protein